MLSPDIVSNGLLSVDCAFILGAGDGGEQALSANLPTAGFVTCFPTELPTRPR